jgi:hypothetical protein
LEVQDWRFRNGGSGMEVQDGRFRIGGSGLEVQDWRLRIGRLRIGGFWFWVGGFSGCYESFQDFVIALGVGV